MSRVERDPLRDLEQKLEADNGKIADLQALKPPLNLARVICNQAVRLPCRPKCLGAQARASKIDVNGITSPSQIRISIANLVDVQEAVVLCRLHQSTSPVHGRFDVSRGH